MLKTNNARALTVLLPVMAVFLIMVRDWIISLAHYLPPCSFYSHFNLYCPSCGNTRSVIALLHGDLLSSLRYNTAPILLLILALLAYTELAAYSFGKQLRILPRKLSFYLVLITLLAVYWVIRNFIPYLTP